MNRIPNKIKTFGSSMFPLLQDQDIVYLKKIKFQNIKVDNILCVKKNEKVFTHRAIYKAKNYLITKGDANVVSDGKVYPRQIIGKVEKVKRNGKVLDIESFYLLQSTLYFQEIVKVKKALDKEKIDFLFLKGLPLHLYFERSHPKRIYADCDILVAKSDSLKAQETIIKFNYKKIDSSLSKSFKKLRDKESEFSYYKVLNGIPVVFDVHLEVVFMMTQLGRLDSLYPQGLIDKLSDIFLKEKRVVIIHNEDFPILSAENLFIYFCLHLFHHNFRGAYRYEFIKKLVDVRQLNYGRVSQVISSYKLENFVYPCFLLLQKHYKVNLPSSFLKSIQPKETTLSFVKKKVLSTNIFGNEKRISEGVNRFKNLFFLSPLPLYRKTWVFLNPQVVYAIFWALSKKLFSKKLRN